MWYSDECGPAFTNFDLNRFLNEITWVNGDNLEANQALLDGLVFGVTDYSGYKISHSFLGPRLRDALQAYGFSGNSINPIDVETRHPVPLLPLAGNVYAVKQLGPFLQRGPMVPLVMQRKRDQWTEFSDHFNYSGNAPMTGTEEFNSYDNHGNVDRTMHALDIATQLEIVERQPVPDKSNTMPYKETLMSNISRCGSPAVSLEVVNERKTSPIFSVQKMRAKRSNSYLTTSSSQEDSSESQETSHRGSPSRSSSSTNFEPEPQQSLYEKIKALIDSKQITNFAPCGFCRKNIYRDEDYRSHPIRWWDIVICPALRAYTCPFCGATGDVAHTMSYCPDNPAGIHAERSRTYRPYEYHCPPRFLKMLNNPVTAPKPINEPEITSDGWITVVKKKKGYKYSA